MKKYHVRYYYLATGMEGRAEQRDHGIIEAESIDAAKESVIKNNYSDQPQNKEFIKGCLIAKEILGLVG